MNPAVLAAILGLVGQLVTAASTAAAANDHPKTSANLDLVHTLLTFFLPTMPSSQLAPPTAANAPVAPAAPLAPVPGRA